MISGEGQWIKKTKKTLDEKEEEEALEPAVKRINLERPKEALHLQTFN